MQNREEIGLALANYILDDKERYDFIENPSKNHIYYLALCMIYDEVELALEIRDLEREYDFKLEGELK